MRFHQEVIAPEFSRELEQRLGTLRSELRDDMNTGFDAVYKRLERLEMELTAITGGLRRVEAQIASLEERLKKLPNADKIALRSELADVKDKVAELEQRIADLEKDLN